MNEQDPDSRPTPAPGLVRRLWQILLKPSVKYSWLGIASVFFALGIVF